MDQRRSFPACLELLHVAAGARGGAVGDLIGWLLHKTVGRLIAVLLFVLPGFVAILMLSFVSVLYGDVPVVGAVFFGLKAALLSVVVEAVLRIGRKALKID